jgi:outer membrane protein OmpA-like peptidoglycan-associated protein
MIFRWIGKQISEKGMNAAGLLDMFKGQKHGILDAVPAGLNLNSVFSSAFPGIAASAAQPSYQAPPASGGGRNKWLLPLLLLLGLLALLWWWFSRDKEPKPVEEVTVTAPETPTVSTIDPATVGMFDSVANRFVYNVGTLGDIKLPDGTVLNVGSNSTEARLFNFLNDANITVDTVDKTKGWISLDRVYFETNKDILTAESVGQLRNIRSILKAFPNATVKFGGYTDNTGNEAANMKLSADRAKAALEEMAGLGIDRSRLASEGYGSMHPIATNETAAGRALNRRVDIRVTKK